jgi:hypothetical protein
MGERIRVFVGCAYGGMDAESMAVLEWSINKHTSLPVDIVWMYQGASEAFTGWDVSKWATPFSGFRWAIPELCGFEGKAIYMDSDMIVLSDLAELWNQDTRGHVVLGKGSGEWRLCVSLWDCAAAKGKVMPIDDMKRIADSHSKMRRISTDPGFIGAFSGNWNCLDREYQPGMNAKILHYTDMRSQPQHRHAALRLGMQGKRHWFKGNLTPERFPVINAMFDDLLAEAYQNGYPLERYL